MTAVRAQRFFSRHTFIFSLGLLIVVLLINRSLQENLFETRVLNGNLRTLTPLMLLAVGQTFVVMSGGIDLSVGAIFSMCNAILATYITEESTPDQILFVIGITLLVGVAAGVLNGICVSLLRLQPIVTTYATSFIYAGVALYVLPQPGGRWSRDLTNLFRQPIEGVPILGQVPVPIVVILLLLLFWVLIGSTRYVQYIYAAGGKPDAAYTTGVPVTTIRFSTYVMCGLFAALAATTRTFGNGTGDPRSGDLLTLPSIVAVVLGGTRLSGGQGSIIGTMIGVVILSTISNILSFAQGLDTWVRTLVDALIIIAALATPGAIRLIRRVLLQRVPTHDRA